MAKQIGAVDQMNDGEVYVEILEGLSNKESATKIAESFAAISNEYLPLDVSLLPSFLPAPPPPQLEEYIVYKRLSEQKKTKSTLPIDIPATLRKIFAPLCHSALVYEINTLVNFIQIPLIAQW